jgi:hypothetical protein
MNSMPPPETMFGSAVNSRAGSRKTARAFHNRTDELSATMRSVFPDDQATRFRAARRRYQS